MHRLCNLNPLTESTYFYSNKNILRSELHKLSDDELNKTIKMYEKKLKEIEKEIEYSNKEYPIFRMKSEYEDLKENLKAANDEVTRREALFNEINNRNKQPKKPNYDKPKLSTVISEKIDLSI